MRTNLLLILSLFGKVFTKEPPDVRCNVMYLKYVECLWDSPVVNHTFNSRFFKQDFRKCDSYIVKDGLNVGCRQHEDDLWNKRSDTFTYRLDQNPYKTMELQNRVKLFPPMNLTVQFRDDAVLCFKWRQSHHECVDSEVRYKVNENNWEDTGVREGLQEYCINFASNSSRYELRVRSRVSDGCFQSVEWSDWSQSVVWGSHNITKQTHTWDPSRSTQPEPLSVWTVIVYCVGGASLLLLIIMLFHHERIRIILIPVVPKPSLVPHDLKEWFDSSKSLTEVYQTNYQEQPCSVREYYALPSSDSESSDSSSLSASTDQTSCSEPALNPDPKDPGPGSSSEVVPHEEQHL